VNAHSTAFVILSDGKVAWCTLELWLFYCTKKKDDRNAAKANHRVYRTVKSTIDYRRGDNAIIHLLKVQRICDTLSHSCEDREWRHFAEYNCILSRLTSVYAFLASICISGHAMQLDRPFYLFTPRRRYMYHWRRRIFIEATVSSFS